MSGRGTSTDGEPITDTGVYTAPDGQQYLIEFLDMVLTCEVDHDHTLTCYEDVTDRG